MMNLEEVASPDSFSKMRPYLSPNSSLIYAPDVKVNDAGEVSLEYMPTTYDSTNFRFLDNIRTHDRCKNRS